MAVHSADAQPAGSDAAVDTADSLRPRRRTSVENGDPGSPRRESLSTGSFIIEDLALPFCSLPEAFDAAYGQNHPYDELEVSGMDMDFVPQLKDVIKRQVTPTRIKLRDKLTFVLGTTGSLLNAYWLGWSPSTFYRVYSIEAVVLIGIRWVLYKLKRWHYYLLDFCYFANIVLLIQLWLLPKSALLHKVMFAYAAGPLAWSIVAFRNSLVFHSLDKITSLMLHWMPACVVWTLRWYPDRSVKLDYEGKSEAAKAEWQRGNMVDLVALPLIPYLLWAIAYYIKIFVVSTDKIQERGYETLYQFATANKSSLFGSIVLRAPKGLRVRPVVLRIATVLITVALGSCSCQTPMVYMGVHMTLVTLTFLLGRLFWESFWAHTVFLIFILSVSAFNGASFYFEVFAHRYVDNLGIPRRAGTHKDE